MDETHKGTRFNYGAFIVQGNGVPNPPICLIQAKADEIELPGGMGTVHAMICGHHAGYGLTRIGGIKFRSSHLFQKGSYVYSVR